MSITTGDSVTLEYTGKLDDGTVFDTSKRSVAEEAGLAEAQPDEPLLHPLDDLSGADLDRQRRVLAVGLEAGETDTLTIPPEQAYGEPSDEHVEEFDTDELQEMLGGQLPEEGAYLEAQDGSQGEIVHVDEEVVRADFNPPLAGETLTFDVEIVAVN